LQKILIIGSTGYIGRNLKKYFDYIGVSYVCLDRNIFNQNSFDLTQPSTFTNVLTAIEENYIQTILDLTASGVSPRTITDRQMLKINSVNIPGFYEYLKNNLNSSINLYRTESILSYTNKNGVHESAYAKSKYLSRVKIEKLLSNSLINYRQLVLHNIYGLDQPQSRFISSIFASGYGGGGVEIRNPLRARDFTYISDVCKSLSEIVNQNQLSDCIEIGTGVATSIIEIVDVIQDIMKTKINVKINDDIGVDNFRSVCAGESKMELYRCQTVVAVGLEKTYRYLENLR
jgi:nucleoside-diphosphate-sugar epimerase